jgi:hypothetical protein
MAIRVSNSIVKKTIQFLGSLKLAVVVIISLAALTSIGTFIEAKLDAKAASQMVYKTWWMYSIMILFVINLTVSMFQRWPWQKRHTPFVLAHIGLIVILAGSLLTFEFGIDGSMRIPVGGKSQLVTINTTDIVLYYTPDGDNYKKLYEREVDFFKNPPKKEALTIDVLEGQVKVIDYEPYTISSLKVSPSESETAGSAVRFQMANAMTQVSEWLVQRKLNEKAQYSFGPATVIFDKIPSQSSKKNEIYLEVSSKAGFLNYAVFSKDDKYPPRKGEVTEGAFFETPWMGFTFKVIRFLAKAEENYDYKILERPTPITNPAIKLVFNNKENWVQLNDVVKLFGTAGAYLFLFKNTEIDLGFPVALDKFEMDRYQGTMRAASYKSIVQVPELGSHTISMNEPLKHQGFTLYQASFQEDSSGTPIATVLSVNRDPGRFLKYLGSLIVSLGIVYLFWARRKASKLKGAP